MLPFEKIIRLDKDSETSLYKQIAFSLINAIQSGTLKAGTRLPGSRVLAKNLGVHRKTIIAAYEELNNQDWITIIPRKHAAVSERIPLLDPQRWDSTEHRSPFENELKLPFRIISEKATYPVTSIPDIFIDDGYPDVRLSPIDELLKTYRFYTSRRHTIKNAHIGSEQGTNNLRTVLVQYLSETRGLNMSSENILITHGAQMSIYLAARLLLHTEAYIVVGTPNYPIANDTFKETGAKLIEVAVDENGMDVDAIEVICKEKRIAAVYVIPHHHYPTTVTLSIERRMKLLELSKQHSFTIIEDDYDYDYHYTSSPYLPLASSGHLGNVLYIGSFSKILDPSLRIGFMVAPKNFIEQCVALRKLVDAGGDGYMQNALAAVIKNGELKRHLKKTRKTYLFRRDALHALLQEKLGEAVSYTLPSGGMAIWVQLHSEYPVDRLKECTHLKIRRVYPEQNAFRFGFASMDEQELETAVSLLQRKIDAL